MDWYTATSDHEAHPEQISIFDIQQKESPIIQDESGWIAWMMGETK